MADGYMRYALGLNTAAFLGPLKGALIGLAGFAGVAVGLGATMKAVWSAIEEGGRLQDLSAKTGVAVKDLFQLQTAFEQVGLSGESVNMLFLRLQRSIGEPTAEKYWKELGLDMAKLRGSGAAQQVTMIAEALSNMERNKAAALASRIFGREGFGQIMAIAGDIQGFREGMAGSAKAAEVFARNAERFDRIGDMLSMIRVNVKGMFAGVAEGLAPGLIAAVQALQKINWVGIGQGIASIMLGVTGAIQQGRFGEVLNLSLKAGIEQFVVYFGEAVKLMVGMLADAFTNASLLKGLWQTSTSVGMAVWSEILPGRKLRNTMGDASRIMAEMAGDSLSKGLPKATEQALKRLREFKGGPTESMQRLGELLSSLAGSVRAGLPERKRLAVDPLEGAGIGSASKSNLGDSLTKVGGFIGMYRQDWAQRTADNTTKMVLHLKGIYDVVKQNPNLMHA